MCDTNDPLYARDFTFTTDHECDRQSTQAPKKRGRPKGSPNKSKLTLSEQPPAEPKKRGRPKKSTLEQP